MSEERIAELIRETINDMSMELRRVFRTELQMALESLRGSGPIELNGVQVLASKPTCTLLGISAKTLYRRRKDGDIGFVVFNGNYFYKVDDILKYIDNHYVEDNESLREFKKKRGTKAGLANFF